MGEDFNSNQLQEDKPEKNEFLDLSLEQPPEEEPKKNSLLKYTAILLLLLLLLALFFFGFLTVRNIFFPVKTQTPLVAYAGEPLQVWKTQSVVLDGQYSGNSTQDAMAYQWICTGGSLSADNVVSPTYTAPDVSEDTVYTCAFTAKATNRTGEGAAASADAQITVKNSSFPVTLYSNLKEVVVSKTIDLLALSGGGPADPTIYNFWCDCNYTTANMDTAVSQCGRPDLTTGNADPFSYSANKVCKYKISGNYTPKTIMEKGADFGEARATIFVVDKPNNPPKISAGLNISVLQLKSATFAATATDPEKDTLTFNWSCESGSLSDSKLLRPVFTAPKVDADKNIVCALTVSDGKNNVSDTKTVHVLYKLPIIPQPKNPPVANAGPDQQTLQNQLVMLDGTQSSDPLKKRLTYDWTCAGGQLTRAKTSTPILLTPAAPKAIKIVCALTVSNGIDQASDTVTISVGAAIPPTIDSPTANAGPDKQVESGRQTYLDGSGSSGAGGSPITYRWTCDGGFITNTANVKPTFTAPTVSQNTDITCSLVVTDNKGNSAADSATVTIFPAGILPMPIPVPLPPSRTCGNGVCESATENYSNCSSDCGVYPPPPPPPPLISPTLSCSGSFDRRSRSITFTATTNGRDSFSYNWSVDGPAAPYNCQRNGIYYCLVQFSRSPVGTHNAFVTATNINGGSSATASCSVVVPPYCGDNECNNGETFATCGDCPAICGNGWCEKNQYELLSENCDKCPSDCGICWFPTPTPTPTPPPVPPVVSCSASPNPIFVNGRTFFSTIVNGNPGGAGFTYVWSGVCTRPDSWSVGCDPGFFLIPGTYNTSVKVTDTRTGLFSSASCSVTVLPRCGDGICNGTETNATCPADCPLIPTPTPTPPPPFCGDGKCNGTETNATCPADCPLIPTPTPIPTPTSSPSPTPSPNQNPVCSAGGPYELHAQPPGYGECLTTLNGYAYDGDGDYLSYIWGCSGATLYNYWLLSPYLQMPVGQPTRTAYCCLTVTDGRGGVCNSCTRVECSYP